MPLVDYGSSDSGSDSEENNDKSEEEIAEDNKDEGFKSSNGSSHTEQVNASIKDDMSLNENKLFSHLPAPKNTFSMPDNTFKLLNKKQPVKIVLPSLNEINKSVDEKDIKKPKAPSKGSGLFALLPAPKHSRSLIPDSVKNKTKPTNISPKPLAPRKVKTPLPPSKFAKKRLKEKDEDEDDEDETVEPESFFFTSTDDVQPDPIEPIEIPPLTSSSSVSTTSEIQNGYNSLPAESSSLGINEAMEVTSEQNDLDPEAIEKLCGTRARKRKGDVPEEIIDINVDSMVGDAYMWLSKDLTKEQEHSSFKKAKNLSVTERRKHQITYLASQAKEKEMELRNQWANSRMTRKQTQSKYGF